MNKQKKKQKLCSDWSAPDKAPPTCLYMFHPQFKTQGDQYQVDLSTFLETNLEIRIKKNKYLFCLVRFQI